MWGSGCPLPSLPLANFLAIFGLEEPSASSMSILNHTETLVMDPSETTPSGGACLISHNCGSLLSLKQSDNWSFRSQQGPHPPHLTESSSTLFLPSWPSDLLYLESLHPTPPPPPLFLVGRRHQKAPKSLYESRRQTLLLSAWAVGGARERLAGNTQVSWVCPHPLGSHCYSHLQVLPTPGVLCRVWVCASGRPFPVAPK